MEKLVMNETVLHEIFRKKARYMQQHFHRLPSFGDLIVDRWEKARFLGFGEGASIYDCSLVLGEVKVGEKTWIGPGTVLDGTHASLIIGSYCSISAGVQIYTHHSVKWSVTGGAAALESAPVAIEDNVYVGPNTIINCGVHIGRRSIIGAQSLVNRDLPECSVAWGQPARIVGRVLMNAAGDDFTVEYM